MGFLPELIRIIIIIEDSQRYKHNLENPWIIQHRHSEKGIHLQHFKFIYLI